MGGRQAHGRPLLVTNTYRKRNSSRGIIGREAKNGRVDVLALAAKQLGETKSKSVRLRDLDVERDVNKRRRGNYDDGDKGGEDSGASKRRRRNTTVDEFADKSRDDPSDEEEEVQSDSDGNEWHIGVGSDDNDSEIDSDEAFGESDDDMFDGYAFRGSNSVSSKSNSKKMRSSRSKDEINGFRDDEYEDEDIGDDGEALGEDAIDLAHALDLVSSDEENAAMKITKKSQKIQNKSSVCDSDVDAFSEDGSQYLGLEDEGSDDMSDSSASDSDPESGSSGEEEDDDIDTEDKLDALQNIAYAFAGQGQKGGIEAVEPAHAKVSLEDLGLDNIKNAQIKKSLKLLAMEENADKPIGSTKKLDVPLARIQQDQLNRVAAAEKARETLGRWVDTVKHNRRVEHLTFKVAGSLQDAGLDNMELRPINLGSAKTELEKTIMAIMDESGLGPSAQAERKQGSSTGAVAETKIMSPEELKQLIGQRRRQRELQSREEARAKRIKKIKSKAYRRVHRREKARQEAALAELEEGDPVDSDEEREAQHRRRAMERMGSRHRESKWAKKAKNIGRAAWDDDFRAGLVDMARRDEELRRRVERRGDGEESSSSSHDSDFENDKEEDEEAFHRSMIRKLEQAGQANENEPDFALLKMPFMKKAELARKKANDEAILEIARDLDPGQVSEDDRDVEEHKREWLTVGRRTYGTAVIKDANNQATNSNQRRKVNSSTSGSGAQGTKQPPEGDEPRTLRGAAKDLGFEDTAAHDSMAGGKVGSWSKTARPFSLEAMKETAKMQAEVEGGSLRVTQALAKLASMSKVKVGKVPSKLKSGMAMKAEVGSEASSLGSDTSSDEDEDRQESTSNNRRRYVNGLNLKDTNLLIKALGDDDTSAEFAREKARVTAEETEAELASGRNKEAEFLPGWGSWVGEGITKRPMRREQKRQVRGGKVAMDTKKAVRKDAKLERVIISERRIPKNEKYLASRLPHEFETKNQYERSLRLPIGPEWGTKSAFQDATKPRVMVKQGVILPMARPLM